MPRVLAALVVAPVAACLVACSRTPEEPAPAASTRTASTLVVPAPTASTPVSLAAPAASTAAPAAPACPSDPEPLPPLPTAALAFDAGARLTVELARTPRETERGLMYRTHMAEDHGMIFRLGAREDHSFWMHNTCIPLDMLFVDQDGTIVGLLEDVPILNDEPRSVGRPSTHVVEANAGWARRHGVHVGQKLLLPAAAK